MQESAFHALVEMMFNGLKEDIKEIRRDVADLKSSLEFSQANISTIESKLDAANDFPPWVDTIPSFEITSDLINLPNLDDYNIDEHIPANVNSSYYTIQDLSKLDISESNFSLFHMNTRSLSPHFDELLSTLATLKINFYVICVSETWNSFENPIKTNVEIPGYSYFLCQSHSQNGGVALYVKSGLSPTPRPDLGKDSADFETVWVEVENKKGKNNLFCCTYLHPNTNLDSFSGYLQEILSSPAVYRVSQKNCLMFD